MQKKLMKEYYEILCMLKPISKKDWLAQVISIGSYKITYDIYAGIHPKLPEFFAKAIKIYSKNIKD